MYHLQLVRTPQKCQMNMKMKWTTLQQSKSLSLKQINWLKRMLMLAWTMTLEDHETHDPAEKS